VPKAAPAAAVARELTDTGGSSAKATIPGITPEWDAYVNVSALLLGETHMSHVTRMNELTDNGGSSAQANIPGITPEWDACVNVSASLLGETHMSHVTRMDDLTDTGGMGWLRLVGSLKLNVSFAKEPYKRDYILQQRPMIVRSLLIVATPYLGITPVMSDTYESNHTCEWVTSHVRMSQHYSRHHSWVRHIWVTSHTWMSHVSRLNESRDTYECVTHMNASAPLQEVVLRECDRNKYK